MRRAHSGYTAEYLAEFEKARNTFLFQLIIDPFTMKLAPLHVLPEELVEEDLDYMGK